MAELSNELNALPSEISVISYENIIFNDTSLDCPEPGNFYTFIYRAKTPNIRYDEFPLIACTEVQRWGFKGFNYHWSTMRNYTWEEVLGQMHLVLSSEISDARSIPYAKFRMSL